MRYFYLKNREQVSSKKRFLLYKSSFMLKKLTFGNLGFYFFKSKNFYFSYFIFLKKFIKNLNKNKYSLKSYFFFWFFLISNYPVTKKSKNSRMGKGKGDFLRWEIRIPYNLIFFEIKISVNFFFFLIFNRLKSFFGNSLKMKLLNKM